MVKLWHGIFGDLIFIYFLTIDMNPFPSWSMMFSFVICVEKEGKGIKDIWWIMQTNNIGCFAAYTGTLNNMWTLRNTFPYISKCFQSWFMQSLTHIPGTPCWSEKRRTQEPTVRFPVSTSTRNGDKSLSECTPAPLSPVRQGGCQYCNSIWSWQCSKLTTSAPFVTFFYKNYIYRLVFSFSHYLLVVVLQL